MTGLMFPVVCAVALSKETLDRFIEQRGVSEHHWFLAFVDSVDDYYAEVSEGPMEVGSDPNSPFVGKTPQECYRLLLKLREDTESEIHTDTFAIMDERSIQDDTVLLVSVEENYENKTEGLVMKKNGYGEDEERVLKTLRSTFHASATALMLYSIGHRNIDEDIDMARETSHVLSKRGHPYKPRVRGGNDDSGEQNTGNRDDQPDVSGLTIQDHGEYVLHEPDPALYIPPHQRREFLLASGERFIGGSSASNTPVGQSTFRYMRNGQLVETDIVKELHGLEKSPAFRDPALRDPDPAV